MNMNNDGVRVKTDKRKYSTRILAGADGIRGAVHRRLIGKQDT